MSKTILKMALIAAALTVAATAATAAPIVFDRGLPTANLNNSAGASRSNVAWGFGEGSSAYYSGDDFTLSAGVWKVNTVRVWATLSPGSSFQDLYSSISLFGGAGTTLTNLKSGATVGNTAGADIAITKVSYANSANYQGSSGAFKDIYQIDFNNLNWMVNGGVTENFSVAGVSNGNTPFHPFFMHASNAGFGGATADGADGLYSAYYDNGSGGLAFDSQINSGLVGNGWDKSSDINVQVLASAVPEPASMALFGVALLGFGAARRKRAVKR